MRSRGKVFGMSVCQFVCLFAHHFLACLGVLGLFKASFGSMKIDLVNKPAFLCPGFESDYAEALKSLFSCHLDAS